MSKFKKFIAGFTAVSTLLWSAGMAVVPVAAVTIADGDLVKTADSSAVYLIQGARKRIFPHANVYFSWYKDFSDVKTVSASDLAEYADDNPVPFRDGSLFRGTTESLGGKDASAVFYVENAKLRPVKSAEIYQALFNDENFAKVTWVPDDLLSKFNYPMGSDIESSAKHPNGCLVKYSGEDQVYLIENGKKRAISSAAMAANNYKEADVLTIEASETYSDGPAVTGAESALLTPGWSAAVGGLTIALDADSPSASNVPVAAKNVVYTKVKLSASGPVSISSITVKRSGLGAASDFDSVGIFEGSTQLSTYKTLNSTTDEATFNISPAISMSAGQVKYLAIKGTLKAAAKGHVNKLSVSAVSSDATVTGLPVVGKEMTGVDITIGKFSVVSMQSVADTSPKIGDDNVELGVLKLNLGSTEDVEISSIKFQQKGTASSGDLSNLAIYQSGTKKGDCSLVKDYITCVFDSPFLMLKDSTKEFKVMGDIESGVDRTVKLTVEKIEDISALGKSYGYNIGYDGTYSTPAGIELTVKTGKITINFNGPAGADVVRNQKNINLANFEITSNGENAELRDVKVSIKVNGTASTSADVMENVELYDPDSGIVIDNNSVDGSKWVFKPYETLSKGVKKTYQIRIDTPNKDIADGTTYQAVLADADLVIKGSTSNQFIAASEISPDSLTGKTFTLKKASLTLNKVNLSNYDVVEGAKGIALYKAVLEGTGENVKVTKIIFDAASANKFADDNVDNLYLYKVVDGTETLVKQLTDDQFSGATATFDGLNLVVEPGSSKAVTFVLRADVADPHSASYNDLQVQIVDASKVSAETQDAGTALTSSAGTLTVNGGASCVAAISSTGTLSLVVDNLDSAVSRDSFVLAGVSTPFIGRIKVTAKNEKVKIEKMALTASEDSSASVNKIELYKADKVTKIADKDWTSGTSIKFDPLNYVVDEGTEYIWIKADLAKIGTGAEDTAVSGAAIKLNVASSDFQARGESSGDLIEGSNLSITGTQTKEAKIVAAKIASVENALADGTLSSGSSKVIAKFKVKAANTVNVSTTEELSKVLLSKINITLTTSSAVTVSNAKIEREGGVDLPASFSFNTDFDLASALPNDHKISSNSEAIFVVKATIDDAATSGTSYLDTSIADLDNSGGNDDIFWSDEAGNYNGVRLDYTEVIGAHLSASH